MKIAAFNAKNLGIRKVTDKKVVHYLTEIVSRYSVVLMIEVMDKSGAAMKELFRELNSSNAASPYCMTASSPLGRDTYKERFVCFYSMKTINLETWTVFAREPFMLRFSCPSTKVKDLVLVPVHTKPTDTLKELDELHDVVTSIRMKWGTDKIMILGDFNADGRYLSKRKKDKLRLCSADYHWLIDDDVDTTTSNSNDHTYDRIVVFGDTMLDAIVPGSAKSFNFQTEFKLTDEEARGISDHYPVEVELRTNQSPKAKRQRRTTPPEGQKEEPQKKKKTPVKRKSGPASNTRAKRRR